MRKVFILITLLIAVTLFLSGCSNQTLGYRKYPSLLVDPSNVGSFIRLRLPLDEYKYVYNTYSCVYNDDGIDVIVHFKKIN